MNAPATAAQLAPAILKVLTVDQLVPSTTHVQVMRRKRFDQVKLQELADSIRKVGVLQPIVARAVLKKPDEYEIVAGERRWLATKLAGGTSIPANVIDVTADVLLEVQLIENLQREGLHEMEEAEGYAELMKLKKISAEQIGDMVGKSRSYVFARLKLLQLGREARDKFYAGEIDASRALEIARILDPERQCEALNLATSVNGYSNKLQYSVRELRERLSADGHVVFLKHAPFPVGDPTLLPDAGSCTACPNRTGNATTRENLGDDPDVCTVVECYHRKVAAESDRKRATLKGDEAKKYARGRKGNYVGHVDLDQPCDQVEFPEPEPKTRDDVDPDNDPAYAAWQERESAWKPPTYRQILDGAKLETIHVEDHRTKRVHELAPLKDVRPLLKKKGITLSSYIGEKPSAVHRSSPPAAKPKNEAPEAKAKREAKEKTEAAEREIDSKIEAEMIDRYPKALFQAARKNYPAKLDRTALQFIAAAQLVGLEDYDMICEGQGWKKTNWINDAEALKKVSTLTEAKLVPLIFDCMLQRAADDGYKGEEDLENAVKTFKVNAATIKKALEAEIRAKHTPKGAAKASPAPAKKKASGKAKKK